MYNARSEDALAAQALTRFKGKVQLIFTSPPFPLNAKKRYGNFTGEDYVAWLAAFAPVLREYLTPDGSIVVEVGNSWEPGLPVMSTLALRSLLAFQEAARLYLCQEFVVYNPARLPSPAQWVTIERIRVKDAFTRLWWMAPSPRPKASNRRVLRPYSDTMKHLLRTRKYNAGRRPSQHRISPRSFLTDNGGAIPPNVFIVSNTRSADPYQRFCKVHGLQKHPARMPVEVPEFMIQMLTEPGDLVMDPFAGSNTTGFAAESLERRWLSIEANASYVSGSSGWFRSVSGEQGDEP
jgi:hypothetical protein